MKKRRQSPADTRTQDSEQLGLFAYEIDEDPLETPVTNHAGLPAVLETFRVLGGREAVERCIRLKQRERGFGEADLVEAFIALLAAGGECPEDFETLRADVGLAQLAMHSACETAGVADTAALVRAASAFYNTAIRVEADGVYGI